MGQSLGIAKAAGHAKDGGVGKIGMVKDPHTTQGQGNNV